MSEQTGTNILPGTEIAGYRIERELGRGSMAVVYRAVQLNLQRPVALKVLSAELASNHEFVGRFFNEARAAAALSHANIIQAYDAGQTEGGIYYFAMEYVEGETVQDRIRRDGAIPARTALRMGEDIADALNYGWQRQRLTHGDIKPENIMVNTEGETKLADFGLAKVAEHDFAGSDVMLTPLYASPEAIRGQLAKGDCRGDIYSFGASLYHMLAGHPPFPGQDTETVLERHLSEQPAPLDGLAADLPPGVSAFVAGLLEKDAAKRPQDWSEVLTRIRDLERGKSAPVRKLRMGTAGAPRRPVVVHQNRAKSSLLLPFMIVVAMITVAFAAFVVFRPPSEPPPAPETAAVAEPAAQPSPPPAPPAGPEERAAQTRKNAQETWEKLQQQLAELDGEPEKCIALLEAFADEHREVWLPPDYAGRMKDYRKAAEFRAAMQQADPIALPGGQQPAPPAAAEPATGEPQAEPVAPPRPRDLPLSREAQREDAFVQLCAQLRALPYRPGTPVDRLQQQAQTWLDTYPEDSERKPLVALAAGALLPSLADCVPRLVAGQANAAGKPFSPDRRTQGVVQELTAEHVVFEERTPHGSIRRRLPWADFTDLRSVIVLSNLALGTPAPSARERRLLLALALMSRDDSAWQIVTAGLAAEPELHYWQSLRQDYLAAEREGPAVDQWQQIHRAFAAGQDDAKTYRLVAELQATRTKTAERYQAELAYIATVCAESLPGVRAGRLVREAQQTIAAAPYEALRTLTFVRARYGTLDFPERGQLENLRDQALAGLERPEILLQTIDRWPAYAFCTQLHGTWGNPPHIAMLSYLELAARDNLPTPLRNLLPAGQVIALTEIGDWAAAADLLPRIKLDRAILPIRDFRGSAAFAAGLLGERFPRQALPADPLEILREAATEPRGRPESMVQLATALADCALITRRCGEPEASLILAEAVDAAPLVQARNNFALSAIAVQLEAGRSAKAGQMLADFAADPQRRRAYGFAEDQLPLLRALADFVSGKAGLDQESLALPVTNYEHYFRLAVSALAARPGQAPASADRLAAEAAPQAPGFGPLGGSALYDLLLLRVADALAAGQLERARKLVEQELADPATARHPYYPRLLFIKAGLARVDGDTGKQTAIIDLVRGATFTNSGEHLLAGLLDPGHSREQIQRELSRVGCRNLRFWGEWLEGTLRIANAPRDQRAKIANSIYLDQCAPAERLLTPALAKYYLR